MGWYSSSATYILGLSSAEERKTAAEGPKQSETCILRGKICGRLGPPCPRTWQGPTTATTNAFLNLQRRQTTARTNRERPNKSLAPPNHSTKKKRRKRHESGCTGGWAQGRPRPPFPIVSRLHHVTLRNDTTLKLSTKKKHHTCRYRRAGQCAERTSAAHFSLSHGSHLHGSIASARSKLQTPEFRENDAACARSPRIVQLCFKECRHASES